MKVVFVTNRGGTHPNRHLYFNSVQADYQFVDFKIRWHGITTSKIKMIFSGIICALSFPERRKYDLFVTSDPQLPVVLMKLFGLLRRNQKVASYLGSQTLFFIYSNYFSVFTRWYYKFLLSRYDAHICNGSMQAQLLANIIQVPKHKIHINFNGVSEAKRKSLGAVSYNSNSTSILFIGNLYSDWRLHYKGIDLLLEAFVNLKRHHPLLSLKIVGSYDQSFDKVLNKMIPLRYRADVQVTGQLPDIVTSLSEAVLYVHPSRGDALPNSLTEALWAGIPAVVSEWTGGNDLVREIDNKLVCKLSAGDLYNSISYYLQLPDYEKIKYSQKAKKLASGLTEESAVARFKSIIREIESQ